MSTDLERSRAPEPESRRPLDCCDHSQLSSEPPASAAAKEQTPWPHAPPHWTLAPGTYFVTASTYLKARHFNSPGKLNTVRDVFLQSAKDHGWNLTAWAILSNHYHFLANSPEASGDSLRDWLREFHRTTAIELNRLENIPGRKIWHNFRETQITHQKSYLARLRYVNQNPVFHRLVPVASHYRWCSAAWFETNAPRSFVASIARFNTDRLNVYDDFEP